MEGCMGGTMRTGTEDVLGTEAFGRGGSDLVPRMDRQGYEEDEVAQRRRWLAERTGFELSHVALGSIPTGSFRGNIENLIGVAQVPLGVAGPLRVNGEFAEAVYYVPLATTEGA